MSRSCQSATFSMPDLRVAAQHAREAAEPLGEDRVALVRHRRGALLARSRTAPRPRAPRCAAGCGSRSRSARARRRRSRSGRAPAWRSRGTTWVETSSAARPERSITRASTVGRHRGVGADGAGELADRDLLEGSLEALQVAVGLEREAGQAQAEGGRLGVDAVGPPDAERLGDARAPWRRARRGSRARPATRISPGLDAAAAPAPCRARRRR